MRWSRAVAHRHSQADHKAVALASMQSGNCVRRPIQSITLNWQSGPVQAHKGGILCLAAAAVCGRSLLFSGGHDGVLRLWQRDASRQLREEAALRTGGGAIFSVSAVQDVDGSCILAAGSFSREVCVWRITSSTESKLRIQPMLRSIQHTGWVRALAMGTVRSQAVRPKRLYSVGCNRVLGWRLPESSCSPQGGCGITCTEWSDTPETPAFEHATYEDEQGIRSHDIFSLCYGNELEVLAAGSIDGTVRCWSTHELGLARSIGTRPCAKWQAHAGRVSALRFGRHGMYSAGFDGYLRWWRKPTESEAQPYGSVCAWELVREVDVGRGARLLALETSLSTVYNGVDGVDGGDEVDLLVCGLSDGQLVTLDVNSFEELSHTQLPLKRGGDQAGQSQTPPRLNALACSGFDVVCFAETQYSGHGRRHARSIALVAADSDGHLHDVTVHIEA